MIYRCRCTWRDQETERKREKNSKWHRIISFCYLLLSNRKQLATSDIYFRRYSTCGLLFCLYRLGIEKNLSGKVFLFAAYLFMIIDGQLNVSDVFVYRRMGAQWVLFFRISAIWILLCVIMSKAEKQIKSSAHAVWSCSDQISKWNRFYHMFRPSVSASWRKVQHIQWEKGTLLFIIFNAFFLFMHWHTTHSQRIKYSFLMRSIKIYRKIRAFHTLRARENQQRNGKRSGRREQRLKSRWFSGIL